MTKAIINRGTCKNPFVMKYLRRLFWLMVKFNFKLHAVYIPGELNSIPDSISRLHEQGQWTRLCILLKHWFHGDFNGCTWTDHMSYGALQVLGEQQSWSLKGPVY